MQMHLFSKQEVINNTYEVLFPIHKTTLGESYRVKGIRDNGLFMLKIYFLDKMRSFHFDVENFLIEAKIHSQVEHPNICKYVEHGNLLINGSRCLYFVVKYISGETLWERVEREGINSLVACQDIVEQVGGALTYLHSLEPAIIHGDVTPLNVMLDYTSGNRPLLFDFGMANYIGETITQFNITAPSIYFCSPEQLRGQKSAPASDIFSLGAILYYLITNTYPWPTSFDDQDESVEGLVNKIEIARRRELRFSSSINIDPAIKRVIIKCLSIDPASRFQSVNEFIDALKGKEIVNQVELNRQRQKEFKKKSDSAGFAKIAGMASLKESIRAEVIDPLLNPKNAAAYGIMPPNGVLFYGPPGCGKTFFAECLAEEVGFNFMKVSPSDVGSVYIHGSQEKIRKLFDEAREKAPTILFLDEIDAMMPSREDHDISHAMSSEVNEWLTQINNCAKNDIFIIGATNLIEKMDKAVLRSGRFDRKIFIPLPDGELREELFNLELAKRKSVIEGPIDTKILSQKTAGRLCSDISLICMDAARFAYKSKMNITEEILLSVIDSSSPSITAEDLVKYGQNTADRSGGDFTHADKNLIIGFKINPSS